jgi:N-acetylglucosamine-6-phosphate deacetylase
MTSEPQAVMAARIFTGETWLADHAVLISDGRIVDLVPQGRIDPAVRFEQLADDLFLAPGFIDLQVNGGGGVLFNDAPTRTTLRRIVSAHRRFGTTALLPTLITDRPDVMRQAITTVCQALRDGEPGIVGLHLEGPFLNPERRGVHRPELIRPLTESDLRLLCEEAPHPLLLTLAPECVEPGAIARLAAAGITVSIGHSAASYERAIAALAEGARGFTHLFNAMPPLAGREPGLVGAALDAPESHAGLIADGHHVHPANLRLALRAKTAGRLVLVTDAMASVGGDMSEFSLQGRNIRVVGERLLTEDGVLAGAHLDMASAIRNSLALMGVSLDDALRMASANPADLLGISATRGRLLPGLMADMTALTDNAEIKASWVCGKRFYSN